MDTSAGQRISNVAAQTGFSASALRYYEGVGLVAPARTPAGYRVYDDHTIERLRFVARGKDLGLSLEEIAELLPAWDGDDCGEVASPLAARVAAKVEETHDRIAELTVLAEELEVAYRSFTHDVTTGPCGPSCTCTPGPVVDNRVLLVLGTKAANRPRHRCRSHARSPPTRQRTGSATGTSSSLSSPARHYAKSETRPGR